MKLGSIIGIKLYHIRANTNSGAHNYTICSYESIDLVQVFLRRLEFAGEIHSWSMYLVNKNEYDNISVNESWLFLDKKFNLLPIETLYIQRLAGI